MIQDCGNTFPSKRKLKANDLTLHQHIQDPQDPAGNLATIYKKELENHIVIQSSNNNRLMPITINNKYQIINVYVQKFNKEFINTMVSLQNKKPTILMGDFNSYLNPNMDRLATYSTKKQPNCNNATAKNLLQEDLIDTFRKLNPSKRKYTHWQLYNSERLQGLIATRIDLALANQKIIKKVVKSTVQDDVTIDTDHKPIMIQLKLGKIKIEDNPQEVLEQIFIDNKDKWHEVFPKKLDMTELNDLAHTPINNKAKLDETAERFSACLLKAVKATFPMKKPNKATVANPLLNNKEYGTCKAIKKPLFKLQRIIIKQLSTGVEEKEDEKEKLIKKLNQNKFNSITETYIPANQTAKELHTQLHKIDKNLAHKMRNIRRKMNNEVIQQRIKKIEERIHFNENTIFNLLATDGRREKIAKIVKKNKNQELQLIHDPKKILKLVENFYKNLFKQKNNKQEIDISEFLHHQPRVNPNSIKLNNINITEIVNELHTHTTNTSPGENQVSYDMLKAAVNASYKVPVILGKLYNSAIELNHIPGCWKGSNTILLQKQQGNFEIENWRPIALLNVEYKLFTGILNKRIKQELVKHNLLPPEQNGFTNNRDTVHCIFPLLQTIQQSLINKTELHVAYIDICKAFDSTNHKALYIILEHMGFKDFVPIIKELFKDIYTRIETEYGFTQKIKITRGVRQGDVISPTLFIIFLAPVMWAIKNINESSINQNIMTNIEGFADDIALISQDNNSLQKSFDTLTNYCDKLSISINAKKSAYAWLHSTVNNPQILYRNLTNKTTEELTPLGANKCYKYLGLYISLNLDWTQQMEQSESAINNCINLILSKRYLYTHHHIKLINLVAQASLGYRMQFIMFPQEWLDKLNNTITKKLNKSIRISSNSDNEFWWLFRDLKELKTLNTARYLTTYYNRIANGTSSQVTEIARKTTNRTAFQQTKELQLSQTSTPDDHLKVALRNSELIIIHKKNTPETLKKALDKFKNNPETAVTINNALKKLSPDLNPPTITPHLNINTQDTTLIAIDGSYKRSDPTKSATSAMIIKTNNDKKCLSFPTIGPHTSFEGEAQALEAALLSTTNVNKVTIITDNKTLRDTYLTIDKWTQNKLMKSSSRATLKRIYALKQERVTKQQTTELHHVYSHLLDNNKPRDYNRKIQEMKEKFPNNWEEILQLNQEVDNLAKHTPASPRRESPHTEGLESTLLLDKTLMHLTTSPNKHIKRHMTQEIKSNWIRRCPNRSERANRSDINWQESIYPIGLNFNKHKSLQNFQHKLKQRLIPTRQHMSDRIKYWTIKNKWPTNITASQRKRLQIKYENPTCLHCQKNHKQNIIANTKHIFTDCTIAKENNNKLQQEILEELNRNNKEKIVAEEVAWWFTIETTLLNPESEEEIALASFNREEGDQGYIPSVLRKYLTELTDDNLSNNSYNSIIQLIHLNTLRKWTTQNKLMDKYAEETIAKTKQGNQRLIDHYFK